MRKTDFKLIALSVDKCKLQHTARNSKNNVFAYLDANCNRIMKISL